MIVLVANILSVVAAFTAAAGWFWSARARVYRNQSGSGYGSAGVLRQDAKGRMIDLMASAARANEISAWAATAAGVSAACQGLGVLLTAVGWVQ